MLFCCLPRFRWRNASLAGGFAGRRFLCGCGFRWFVLIDLLISRTYVLVQSFSCLLSCKDRAFSATSANLEEKKQKTWAGSQALGQGVWSLLLLGASTGVQRLWSSNTCVLVRLRFCGTCGLATILLPLTKSQPVGCVHSGGASSTPMSDTASGCNPLLCHC